MPTKIIFSKVTGSRQQDFLLKRTHLQVLVWEVMSPKDLSRTSLNNKLSTLLNFKQNFVNFKADLIDKVFANGLLKLWLWLWKRSMMQISTNKYQTICRKKDSKMRKGKLLLVTGSCEAITLFWGVFRILSNIKDGADCKNSEWLNVVN